MIHGTPSRAGCRQTVRPHAYARKHEPGSDGDKPAAGPGHVPARGIAAPRHCTMPLVRSAGQLKNAPLSSYPCSVGRSSDPLHSLRAR